MSLVCQVDANSERAALLRRTDAFIWDEASMANGRDVAAVSRLLQDLMGSAEPFGSKLFIFAGDYRQIAPVLPGAGLGDGRAAEIELENDPVKVISLPNIPVCTSMADLINFVYPADILSQPDQCAKRAILCGTNAGAAQINSGIVEGFPGEATTLHSVDRVKEMEAEFGADPGFLAQFYAPGVPDSELTLKVGCGLVNGARLIVTAISPLLIHCRKPGTQEVILLSRVPFTFRVGRGGMEVVRRQFPIRVAYAITVNKSQGQTLDKAGIDLRADVFQHGQLYVALGRVRTRDDLMVLVREHRVDADSQMAYAHNL
ncbi:ATP-dependent DNA helicase, partial [Frankliniella fusca]